MQKLFDVAKHTPKSRLIHKKTSDFLIISEIFSTIQLGAPDGLKDSIVFVDQSSA